MTSLPMTGKQEVIIFPRRARLSLPNARTMAAAGLSVYRNITL